MKRAAFPLETVAQPRKRFCRQSLVDEDQRLTYKLKMLQNWEIASQASEYLQSQNRVETVINPSECVQLALVPYRPNIFQQMIDQIASRQSFPPESFSNPQATPSRSEECIYFDLGCGSPCETDEQAWRVEQSWEMDLQ